MQDLHARALTLYHRLPRWDEPGSRNSPSDRLIRFTHLIDGIAALLVDMTSPQLKAEPLTTAPATQIAPTEDNPSDAGLCNCPEGKCLIAWDAPVPRNCRAASTSQKTQASSQSAPHTMPTSPVELDCKCAAPWIEAFFERKVTDLNHILIHKVKCKNCGASWSYDKTVAQVVQQELSTSVKRDLKH